MVIFTLNTILPHVIRTAKSAGEFIRKERLKFTPDKIEMKGLNDMVSYVDKGAEKLIVEELKEILPGSGFIVEEDTEKEKSEYNWIVDPLDGTTNFIHGIPCYAVSIALEHKGEILLGVVYEVAKKECYSAVKGGGAFLNEIPIKVSANKTLKDSLIATGFPIYNFDRQENYLNVLRELMQKTHGVRRIGAAAADLCYLAAGRVDAFFEYNLNAWDVAAGALIIREAGGTVTDFRGEQNWLYGKEIIATNVLVEDEFKQLIQTHFTS
jgi:myo-inositol-1(or 4)-monophosphatase